MGKLPQNRKSAVGQCDPIELSEGPDIDPGLSHVLDMINGCCAVCGAPSIFIGKTILGPCTGESVIVSVNKRAAQKRYEELIDQLIQWQRHDENIRFPSGEGV
jgi:hypothetical protein